MYIKGTYGDKSPLKVYEILCVNQTALNQKKFINWSLLIIATLIFSSNSETTPTPAFPSLPLV